MTRRRNNPRGKGRASNRGGGGGRGGQTSRGGFGGAPSSGGFGSPSPGGFGGSSGGFGGGASSSSTGGFGGGAAAAQDILAPVLPLDTKYSAAGILPYRVNPQTGKLEVMMAIEHRKDKADGPNAKKKNFVNILGGTPRTDATQTDQNYIVTAVRQLHVKSGEGLPNDSVNGIMKLCAENQTDKLASYFWAKGKYVLIVYPWAHDVQFVEQFNGTRGSNRPHTVALSLQWLPVEALYNAATNSASMSVANQSVRIYSLLRSLLREASTLAQYLSGLQTQLGGGATPPSSPFGAAAGGGGALFGSAPGTPTGGALFGGGAASASTSSGGMFGSPSPLAPTPAAGDFEGVASQFGSMFYQAFNTNKAALQQFLTAETRFVCVGEEIVGAQAILAKLQSMNMQLQPEKMSAQPMPGMPNNTQGVIMVVLGKISSPATSFSQVFTLAPVNNGVIILNMLLRDI